MITTDRSTAWRIGLTDLRRRVQGEIVEPDPAADALPHARCKGQIVGPPALVVRCTDALDVAAAVSFARAQDAPLAVRNGPTGLHQDPVCGCFVVLDLSRMRGIEVDTARHTARVEAGLTWSEVATAVQPYDVNIDNLHIAELVTADGRFVRASAVDHAELVWGMLGGRGSVGVATAFAFDLPLRTH